MARRGEHGGRGERRARAATRAAARAAIDERRARMRLQAHLAWLDGVGEAGAGGLRWWRLDGSPPFTVDGMAVARAARARRALLRDHAAALPDLVGDPGRWSAGVGAALAAIGAAVRDRARPVVAAEQVPARIARLTGALAARHPALAPVLDAAVVARLARPAELTATLRWIDGCADRLAALVHAEPGPPGALAVLRLAALARAHGARSVAPLVALAASDATNPSEALAEARALATSLRRGARSRARRATPLRTLALDWLAGLAARDRPAPRRALELLAGLALDQAVAGNAAWQTATAAAVARARELVDGPDDRGPTMPVVRARLEQLEAAIATCPPAPDVAATLRLVDATVAPARQVGPALLRLLTRVPVDDDGLARQRALAGLVAAVGDGDGRRHAWLWDALCDQLDGGVAATRLLAPWLGRRDDGERDNPFPVPTSDDAPLASRAAARRTAALLGACATRAELTREGLDTALALVDTDVEPDVVAAIADRRPHVHGLVGVAGMRAAVALGAASADQLIRSLDTVAELVRDLPVQAGRDTIALIEHACADDATWLVHRLARDRRARGVGPVAALAAAVPRRRWPPFTVERSRPRWIAGYPDALHAALDRLASVDPDAATTARRVLHRDLPHPDDVAGELAFLRAAPRLDRSATGRLRRLEAAPRPPGAARLARLADKLERTAAAIALDRFGAATRALGTAAVAEACGLPAWPDWPLDRLRVAALLAVPTLPGGSRRLALELLRRRTGPPPWDLRDHPRNRAFLDQLRGRGIDPAPWLDGEPVEVTADNGARVRLGLARDPLDVFVMGAHFATCLSPGDENFFSVVANAADVNKQVLYAHHRDGTVAGRCLLALTDGGGIVTFHPYAHDRALGFPGLVRDHARALAAAMATEVVGHGPVTTLVADDWYDDGTVDLVGRFAALADDAPLRRELTTIAPAELPARLVAALDHALDAITLPLVVELPEVVRRPELLVALAPALAAATGLPEHTRVAAAAYLFAAGHLTLADRLLGERIAPWRLYFNARRVGDVLAVTRPSLALALLRASRPRDVRGWNDESPARLVVAARALESLHRPRQAARLYRLAIARGSRELRDELRPRLAALDRGH